MIWLATLAKLVFVAPTLVAAVPAWSGQHSISRALYSCRLLYD